MKSKDKERVIRATRRLQGERRFRPVHASHLVWVIRNGENCGTLMDSDTSEIRQTIWDIDIIEFQVKCGNWIEI